MAKSTKGKSIYKHLHTDCQVEFYSIMNLAGTNPEHIQNKDEVKSRWTAMVQGMTDIDNTTKATAIEMLHNADKVVLSSMAAYYTGISGRDVNYHRYK